MLMVPEGYGQIHVPEGKTESDNSRHTAPVLYSLTATAKRHGPDTFACLRDVIGRISDHPSNKLHELLPDHWKLAQAAKQVDAAPPSQA